MMGRLSRRWGRLLVALSLFVPAGGVVACGSGLPSASSEASLTAYAAARSACIVQAKTADAGLPGYETCARHVDERYGLADAGGAGEGGDS